MDSIYIYSDASFSKRRDLAVVGYALFDDSHPHDTVLISQLELNLEVIKEKNNIRAEIRGVIAALKACPKGARVIVYTDCQAIINLPSRREKLESRGFTHHSGDLYREFYLISDSLKLELVWIMGHSPTHKMSRIQKNFSYIDKAVRKKLREIIK